MPSTAELYERWRFFELPVAEATEALLEQVADPAACLPIVDARHLQGLRALAQHARQQYLDQRQQDLAAGASPTKLPS